MADDNREDVLRAEIAQLKRQIGQLEKRIASLEWRADHNYYDPESSSWEVMQYNLGKNWPLMMFFLVMLIVLCLIGYAA